jgi:signal peptidase
MGGVLRVARRALATAVVILAGAALVAGVIVPRLTGATPYAVQSGSMAPTLRVGELIVVRPADRIATGDVITYQVHSGQPQVVTHRVVGVGMTTAGERVYQTRGDANDTADRTQVRAAQVRGVLWYHLPYLGYVSVWLPGTQHQGVVAVIAMALLAYAGWSVLRAMRERRQRRGGTPPPADPRTTGDVR